MDLDAFKKASDELKEVKWEEVFMTSEQYEDYLKTRTWDEETKKHHRTLFKGVMYFSSEGTIRYKAPK